MCILVRGACAVERDFQADGARNCGDSTSFRSANPGGRPSVFLDILKSQNRDDVGPTAPARALWLEKVWYPEKYDLWRLMTQCDLGLTPLNSEHNSARTSRMQLQVTVEKPSSILRKLTIKVPASVVATRFNRGLAEVQKDAKLKGFRPGQAPIAIIKQYYGADIRHRVYHNLIDESFQEAVRENKLMAVGRPTIESPDHKHGEGDHDHAINEDKDFTFTATIEILPEIEVKGYTGLALTQEKKEVTEDDVEKVIQGMLDSQAQIEPVAGGLVQADGILSLLAQ